MSQGKKETKAEMFERLLNESRAANTTLLEKNKTLFNKNKKLEERLKPYTDPIAQQAKKDSDATKAKVWKGAKYTVGTFAVAGLGFELVNNFNALGGTLAHGHTNGYSWGEGNEFLQAELWAFIVLAFLLLGKAVYDKCMGTSEEKEALLESKRGQPIFESEEVNAATSKTRGRSLSMGGDDEVE